MNLSYRGVAYESAPTRRLLEQETTAKYRGVEYTIQQFGQVLPAPKPNLKYRGVGYHPCLTATQVRYQHFPQACLTDSDYFIN